MFYRRSGKLYATYVETQELFPIKPEQALVYLILSAGCILPIVASTKILAVYITPWLIWTSCALGLSLLMGWAGQFNFGYAALMGVGAYTAIHAVRFGVPWIFSFILGGLFASIIGLIFSAAAMRVKGLYLALVTLALQFAFDWVVNHSELIRGGTQAAINTPEASIFSGLVKPEIDAYYVVLIWCIIVTYFMLNLKRAPLGRCFVAIREKDFAAEIIGINSFYYKATAFAVSSFIGGVSGALLVFQFTGVVSPEQFGLDVSIIVTAMVIIGGMASIIGAYFGSAFILLLPGFIYNHLSTIKEQFFPYIGDQALYHIPSVVYGAAIVVVLLVEPLGLAKLYDNVRNYLIAWPFRDIQDE